MIEQQPTNELRTIADDISDEIDARKARRMTWVDRLKVLCFYLGPLGFILWMLFRWLSCYFFGQCYL